MVARERVVSLTSSSSGMFTDTNNSVQEFFPRVCMQPEFKVILKLPSKKTCGPLPLVSFSLKVAKDQFQYFSVF